MSAPQVGDLVTDRDFLCDRGPIDSLVVAVSEDRPRPIVQHRTKAGWSRSTREVDFWRPTRGWCAVCDHLIDIDEDVHWIPEDVHEACCVCQRERVEEAQGVLL